MTEGVVALQNNHPFWHRQYLMMHNGGIQDFEKIKLDLVSLLDEEAFLWIQGQSDTQYILALFMTNFIILLWQRIKFSTMGIINSLSLLNLF